VKTCKGVGNVFCRQQVYGESTHCSYHEKRLAGLLAPLEEYLSDTEIDATMGGREHHDGRRLDHFHSSEDSP
jgi:hypothetical protein